MSQLHNLKRIIHGLAAPDRTMGIGRHHSFADRDAFAHLGGYYRDIQQYETGNYITKLVMGGGQHREAMSRYKEIVAQLLVTVEREIDKLPPEEMLADDARSDLAEIREMIGKLEAIDGWDDIQAARALYLDHLESVGLAPAMAA